MISRQGDALVERGRDPPKPPVIELQVHTPHALFHSLDPSPLIGRDLDDAVERYIVESALEAKSASYTLVLHIADGELTADQTKALADSIRAYFAYRREEESRKLRWLMREGKDSLVIGLAFLCGCSLLGLLATQILPAPVGSLLNEGLLIIGWVANWRPVEIFLHGWRPLVRQRAVFAALAKMEVEVLQPPPPCSRQVAVER